MQEELGLNMTAMDWRQYDSAIGRFVTIDPETDEIQQLDKSPYAFCWNNPVMLNDPDGRNPIKKLIKALLSKRSSIVSSVKSYTKLVAEHKQKIEDFKKDPIGNCSKEWLAQATKDNPSQKVLLERAKGRIPALEKQLKKQEGELVKAQNNLKDLDTKVSELNKLSTSAVVAKAAEKSDDKGEEFAKDAIGFGAKMTDFVENFGTNVFGDNEFGRMIDEFNPLNLGFSDLMKYADKVLKEGKKEEKKQKK